MTSLNPSLRLALLQKAKGKKNIFQKGFTLVELMTVIVIVGVLSAVALPTFLNQTKKAAATEASQQVSSIFKQMHTYVLEKGALNVGATPTIDTTCVRYAGTQTSTTDGAKFTYACAGTTPAAITITATGLTTNKNTNGTTVVLTGNAEKGTVTDIAVTTS